MRSRTSTSLAWCVIAVGALILTAAADARDFDWLKPREIEVSRVNVAPELVEATRDSQIERGKRRAVIDGLPDHEV